jgi:chloramphenicol-sensitive protein RarD
MAGLLILLTRSSGAVLAVLRSPRTFGWLACSALLIGINWSTFVWAVNAGHTLDASLGYYLNPLLSVAAGLLLFGERVSPGGWAAIALAAVGVAVQTAAHGGLPVLALAMAVSFCLYGVIRKRVAADAQTGLFVECVVLAVPALAYGIHMQASGAGHALRPMSGLLLFLGGPATVAPLATFAWAARRMPLSTLGFLQFIAPTMQFAIGVWSGEPLPPLSVLAFVFIWAGVAVYAADAWTRARRAPSG